MPAKGTMPLCEICQHNLPWDDEPNPFSKTEIPYTVSKNSQTAFSYQPPISHWISALKFHSQLHYAKLLGQLLTHSIQQEATSLPDTIIPIPLHTRRLCQRGFNQSIEIAKVISRKLHIPLDIHSLKRKHHTQPQSRLTAAERERNLSRAFYCTRPITTEHIVLLDDVITTGHTSYAAYQTLIASGAKRIDIWCCAKSQLGRST